MNRLHLNSQPAVPPGQHDILNYRGGKLGVAAVPGSGQNVTLVAPRARLVERLTEHGLAERTGSVDRHVRIRRSTASRRASANPSRHSAVCCRTSATVCGLCTACAARHLRERPSLVGLPKIFALWMIARRRPCAVKSWTDAENVARSVPGLRRSEANAENMRRIQFENCDPGVFGAEALSGRPSQLA